MLALTRIFPLVFLLASTFSQAEESLRGPLMRCSAVTDNEARLACFDRVAKVASTPASVTSTVSGELNTTQVPQEVNEKSKKSSSDFGFEKKRAREEEKAEDPRVFVDVSEVKRSRTNTLTIYLTDGQVWRQTDALRFLYTERQGRAYLERGAMGSFFFSQENIPRKIRVKRLK